MAFLLKKVYSALSSRYASRYDLTLPDTHRDLSQSMVNNSAKIIALFNKTFKASHNTILIGGGLEPEYLPAADKQKHNRIIFSHDYISSALHEIAHWCIAGKVRRQQVDYGYWYVPDGRNKQQQTLFEQVEIKPQALEWYFSRLCGIKFSISVDNINGDEQSSQASREFKQKVVAQVQEFCQDGLNVRAKKWADALQNETLDSSIIRPDHFTLADLN